MTAYYNEIDPYAAQWLRNLIDAGEIAPGYVDERSIEDVTPGDLRGFTQHHFFAGIEFGAMHLEKPDGQTTRVSGQEVAHANLSARQAKEKGLMTSGTYGRHSSGLLKNAILASLLANRLQAQTASLGSTLYKLTWKVRTTPLQVPILRCGLRFSAHQAAIVLGGLLQRQISTFSQRRAGEFRTYLDA